jgi:hypothetical protein
VLDNQNEVDISGNGLTLHVGHTFMLLLFLSMVVTLFACTRDALIAEIGYLKVVMALSAKIVQSSAP